ncbi:unnamed protein product, partial [Prorocentrum cordatum]
DQEFMRWDPSVIRWPGCTWCCRDCYLTEATLGEGAAAGQPEAPHAPQKRRRPPPPGAGGGAGIRASAGRGRLPAAGAAWGRKGSPAFPRSRHAARRTSETHPHSPVTVFLVMFACFLR